MEKTIKVIVPLVVMAITLSGCNTISRMMGRDAPTQKEINSTMSCQEIKESIEDMDNILSTSSDAISIAQMFNMDTSSAKMMTAQAKTNLEKLKRLQVTKNCNK